MRHVTLYSRPGCHLCDRVRAVMEDVLRRTPFTLDVVDIDSDPALKARYDHEVPVVAIDGRIAFGYAMDAREFERRVRGDSV